MGAQQSVNLSCVVDRLTHAPGENVKGSVFLQVNDEELSKFEGITVTLAGVECLRIPETGEIIPGGRKITIIQDVVKFEDGKITKGEYEFAFSLALPFAIVSKMDMDQGPEDSTVPALVHERSDSYSSTESSESSTDYVSTASDPNQSPMPVGNKQIMYQIKACLKRKKGVPITTDTDFRCKAHSAGDIPIQ